MCPRECKSSQVFQMLIKCRTGHNSVVSERAVRLRLPILVIQLPVGQTYPLRSRTVLR
jgi:hypothetical protein